MDATSMTRLQAMMCIWWNIVMTPSLIIDVIAHLMVPVDILRVISHVWDVKYNIYRNEYIHVSSFRSVPWLEQRHSRATIMIFLFYV